MKHETHVKKKKWQPLQKLAESSERENTPPKRPAAPKPQNLIEVLEENNRPISVQKNR